MSAPKTTTITVESQEQIDTVITQYATQGFTVVNRSARSATLQKKKKFNIAMGIIGFLFCFIGLGIYAIYYANQPDAEVIEIKIK